MEPGKIWCVLVAYRLSWLIVAKIEVVTESNSMVALIDYNVKRYFSYLLVYSLSNYIFRILIV